MPKHDIRPFTSHVKMMTLTLIMPHWQRWFYQREIQMITGIAYTPVRAALLSLSDGFGLAKKRTHGNRQYYMIDKDFFLYEEYKRIVLKTTGLGDHLRWVASSDNDIVAAFVYGDFAEGTETTDTPVRFCLVGGLPEKKIRSATGAAKKLTQKEFECIRFTTREYTQRLRKKDPELTKILKSDRIFVVGKEASLGKLVER